MLRHRQVLDQDVRRQHDGAGHALSGSCAAYSSAIEPPSLWPNSQGGSCVGVDVERRQQRRQHLVRLAVHEVQAPGFVGGARRRAAVAGARVDQAAAAGGVAQALREVAPHRQRAQAFVQEDDQRRAAALAARSTRARCARGGRASRCRRTSTVTVAPRLQLAQLEALDLAGGGLRQVGDELDLARVLVGRQLVLHEGLQLGVGGLRAGLEHDEGLGLGQALGVGHADHRGLEHRRVLHQRGLDLEGRDVDAADLEHVVAAAAVGVAAVGVAHVLVAALGPAALEGVARLRAVAPVHHRGRGAVDVEVARLAVGHRAAVVAAQFDLVARHRPAGGAVAHLARAGWTGRCAASRWSRCRRRCRRRSARLKRSPSSAGSASPADDTRRSATSLARRQVRARRACRRSRSARRRTPSA